MLRKRSFSHAAFKLRDVKLLSEVPKGAVQSIHISGNDLTSLRGPKTARACYRACEKTKGCAAFTFIASQEKTAPKSKCWLKKAGYYRGAEHASGTVSGVVRRE